MKKYTNTTGVSPIMAVWLASDDYDYNPEGTPTDGAPIISATQLLKPTRELILSKRVKPENVVVDVLDRISARFGQAMHGSIEDSFRKNYKQAMLDLGYPQRVIDAIRINPSAVEPGTLPVYLEQRGFRKINGVWISGKFDQIFNGGLEDTKTTSVYAYINGSNDTKYREQMSIYRWIMPDKVIKDTCKIQFIFTDWQKAQSKSNDAYPNSKLHEETYTLLSLQETEQLIVNKLEEIKENKGLPESKIIRCTKEELWMSDPVYKYYGDASKAELGGRSTKNFTSLAEANAHMANKGKGAVKTVEGQVKKCGYCSAFTECSQKNEYL